MPQVKELKELDVAGSATNKRGRYEVWRHVLKFFVSASFYAGSASYEQRLLGAGTVTGYKQDLLPAYH